MENLDANEISIKSIQKELLEMLEWLVDVCRNNNITYYLAGGTLLGAVRHNGFIPWDDDIDVMLPREQYQKLIDICSNSIAKRYSIKALETDRYYDYPYAKLENTNIIIKEAISKKTSFLWIDIFPIDGTPNCKIKRQIHLHMVGFLKLARWESNALKYYYKNKWKLFLKILIFWPCILCGSRRISLIIEKIARKYDFGESYIVACVVGKYNSRECLEREKLEFGLDVNFEGLEVKIPSGYHEYLTSLYGDYMKVPKEDDRKKHIGI